MVPLHGVPGYIDVIADVMPLRYAVDLVRGIFFHGTPGYQEVVTTSPALDAVVIAGVFAVAMTAGALVFDYRERTP
ncbi:MAG TPA: hypothetical protein VFE59_21570 [Trebonia sp.]|nr:hypothetical protein [Trebonia sp.]